MSEGSEPVAETDRTNDGRIGAAQVVEWLRERIRSGVLRPGQRLVEADLVSRLNSSRMHVREALRRLETDGLVEVHEHRAAFVRSYSKRDVLQFNRAREVLEGLAARLVAERPMPDHLRTALEDMRRSMDEAAARNDRSTYRSLNQQFHDLILQSCGNEYVVDAVEKLRTPVVRLQLSDVLGTMIQRQNDDHHRIVAALLAGDPLAAETAMRDHIRDGGAAIAAVEDRHFVHDI